MMRARGVFKYANLTSLKSQAIELPYNVSYTQPIMCVYCKILFYLQNDRYALLVVLPNAHNGLSALLANFDSSTLPTIVDHLSEETIDISLPKFNIDSISGAEKSLCQAGLQKMFTKMADFSGISTEHRLHIDELQQHVSVRVDEGSSSENVLTATNTLRSNLRVEHDLVANHPFLFAVRDVVDNVLIVAGKMVNPTSDDGQTSPLQD